MGWFITFEGIEGCGKTTQIKRLATELENQGHSVRVTREPGGCPIADQIRSILLDGGNRAMTPLAELLLYAAARAQHIAEVIAPALAAGQVVLCDRFTDATLAYQGYARGLDLKLVNDLNTLATTGIKPDLTILLDCPVEIGLGRATTPVNAHGIKEERFELESLAFHQRVRNGYLEIARQEPERLCVLPADGTVDSVNVAVTATVLNRLAGN